MPQTWSRALIVSPFKKKNKLYHHNVVVFFFLFFIVIDAHMHCWWALAALIHPDVLQYLYVQYVIQSDSVYMF